MFGIRLSLFSEKLKYVKRAHTKIFFTTNLNSKNIEYKAIENI